MTEKSFIDSNVMKKPKIYLETTLFNYYFDADRDAHPHTVELFAEIAAGKYEAFTSDAVMDELEDAPAEKYEKMFALVGKYPIQMLIADNADTLADLYVAEGIIPVKYRTDGLHIAVAAMHNLDFVVSLNYKHIVKSKVKRLANAVNVLHGLKPIEIVTPMEIIEHEDA